MYCIFDDDRIFMCCIFDDDRIFMFCILQVVQQQQKAAMPGNGRAAHRRGPRGEPRPGGGGGPPTEQMGGMSLGGGGGGPSGERGHRRGGLVVQEPHTRPHHITDKKG